MTMVKVQCPICKGEGRIPASEMAENIEDWIPCPECLGKNSMEAKKEDRVKKTRQH
jgi:DnaJ-class molecular chaperone